MDLKEPKHFFTPLLFRNIVSITESGSEVIVLPPVDPLLALDDEGDEDEDEDELRLEDDELLALRSDEPLELRPEEEDERLDEELATLGEPMDKPVSSSVGSVREEELLLDATAGSESVFVALRLEEEGVDRLEVGAADLVDSVDADADVEALLSASGVVVSSSVSAAGAASASAVASSSGSSTSAGAEALGLAFIPSVN